MGDMFFKKCSIRIPRETPMAMVMTILGEAGVLLDGRYKLESTWDGTRIEYLGTHLQQMFVEEAIEHFCKGGSLKT
jgi:hypothetical protein